MKLFIFERYFIPFFEIFICLDGRAKKACPATSCGPCTDSTKINRPGHKIQGPHEVAGQVFLALPSKQMKISKNGKKYVSKINNLASKVIKNIFMSNERMRW